MNSISRLLAMASLVLPLGAFAAGAIAVDDESGDTEPGYGFVTGASSRDEAGSQALTECRKAGNKNCKVVVRFDKCGAYASSAKNYGYSYGTSLAEVRQGALDNCGQSSCKVIAAECE